MDNSNYEYYRSLLQSLQPSPSYFETMQRLYVDPQEQNRAGKIAGKSEM